MRNGIFTAAKLRVLTEMTTATLVHKKSTRGRRDMLNIFCLVVLHIRIATIIRKNAKFNDNFYFGTTRLLLQNPKR